MAFTVTNTFTNGTVADADEVNTNFTDVETQFDADTAEFLIIVPIGSVTAWLKSYTNTPNLDSRWVECNGQTLSDGDSVFNGQTIPDLNGYTGAQNFLRGGGSSDGSTPTASGATGGAETASISAHSQIQNPYHWSNDNAIKSYGNHSDVATIPPYYEVVWIMRIK